MNYRQIIRKNNLEISRFLDYLRKEKPGYVIEGHCPSLTGLDLARFLYLGINGDYTEHTLEEVRQRIENGMFFELQDKILREEIISYIENNLFEYVSFVTDDTMADTLYETGQLNAAVEKAVKNGKIDWQGSGCLLVMAVERHGKNGNIGYGFATGDCLKKRNCRIHLLS